VLVIALASAGGCGGGTTWSPPQSEPLPPLVFDEGCQPLLAETTKADRSSQSLCFLPYPSSYPIKAVPRTKTGELADLRPDARPPFFSSTAPVIVGTLAGDVVDDGFPKITDDWQVSTSKGSATTIIGPGNPLDPNNNLIPHYTELVDMGDALHKAIVLHPLVPLQRREVHGRLSRHQAPVGLSRASRRGLPTTASLASQV
jgi:hypothetical protein